jgi:hypothetical protein
MSKTKEQRAVLYRVDGSGQRTWTAATHDGKHVYHGSRSQAKRDVLAELARRAGLTPPIPYTRIEGFVRPSEMAMDISALQAKAAKPGGMPETRAEVEAEEIDPDEVARRLSRRERGILFRFLATGGDGEASDEARSHGGCVEAPICGRLRGAGLLVAVGQTKKDGRQRTTWRVTDLGRAVAMACIRGRADGQ